MQDIHTEEEDKEYYSVIEISRKLKNIIENNCSNIKVKGEISGLKKATSGHIYFNIKESDSILACTCWRNVAVNLKFDIKDGLEVIVQGSISSYPNQSKYQLNITNIKPYGIGTMMRILEDIKKKLIADGLFDKSRKKQLPKYPKSIGIITSPTGSVIQDMLHRIKNRGYPVKIFLWPVAVQGSSCSNEIIAAIKGFNSSDLIKTDFLIIARGGGSIEDLWHFNDEYLLRVVSSSNIPIVSAIGHETDFTLLDFVADLRSPTPTAAIELSIPSKLDLQNELNIKYQFISMYVKNSISKYIDIIYKTTILNQILNIIHLYEQKIDNINYSKPKLLEIKSIQLSHFHDRFSLLPKNIEILKMRLDGIDINTSYIKQIDSLSRNIEYYTAILNGLDIKKALEKGFAILTNTKGIVIKNSKSLLCTNEAFVYLHDDTVRVKISSTSVYKK